ncbi:Uncharacterised protein [Segatella copri]|nr:Uncharacterised protein [Segatella copri]
MVTLFSPTMQLVINCTPRAAILATSSRTTDLGKRYSGIPYINTPPGSAWPSKMVTLKP